MKVQLKNTSLNKLTADLLVLPVAPPLAAEKKAKKKNGGKTSLFDPSSASLMKEVSSIAGPLLMRQLRKQDFRPGFGKRAELPTDGGIGAVRLSGLSALDLKNESALDEWRRLGGDAWQSAKRLNARNVAVVLSHVRKGELEQVVTALVEGASLADYEFLAFKGKRKKSRNSPKPQLFIIIDERPTKALEQRIAESLASAEAVCFARDLANTPPSDLNPAALVRRAEQVRRTSRGIKLRVYDRRALTRMKAFALLGVGRGSSVPPALLHLSYVPPGRARGRKVITLIGKGVTFDSGGLSIKTGKGMVDMKCDMAGAACVLAVMRGLAALPKASRIKHEVHALIPTTENMINGESLKPGDVIAAMNGTTIEVLNTDAEGRLILADALCYSSRIKSDFIVDLATLTGACVVALGSDYAGMFATERELGLTIQRAFQQAGEKVWPLPLAAEYRAQMESDVADIRNIGTGGPGAILGALFLKEFVPTGVPWVHLDIAGPAFVTKGNEYLKRGGTGFGVLSLLKLLQTL